MKPSTNNRKNKKYCSGTKMSLLSLLKFYLRGWHARMWRARLNFLENLNMQKGQGWRRMSSWTCSWWRMKSCRLRNVQPHFSQVKVCFLMLDEVQESPAFPFEEKLVRMKELGGGARYAWESGSSRTVLQCLARIISSSSLENTISNGVWKAKQKAVAERADGTYRFVVPIDCNSTSIKLLR